MSRTPDTPDHTSSPRRAVAHPVWSLTLPAWASSPAADRRGTAAPAFGAALARLRRTRRGAEPAPAPDPADPAA